MPFYLIIISVTFLTAAIPTDALTVSFSLDLVSLNYSFVFPSDPVRGKPSTSAVMQDLTGSCPVIPDQIFGESLGDDPTDEPRQFMFLDLHTDEEPYYAADTVQPGLLLLIGTSMIVLALFSRRMFH